MHDSPSCGYCDNGLIQYVERVDKMGRDYIFMAYCNCQYGLGYKKFVKVNGKLTETRPNFPMRDPTKVKLLTGNNYPKNWK